MKKVFACLLVTAIMVAGLFFGDSRSIQTGTVPLTIKRPVIVLDAGHGGVDGGAVAKDGTAESGINLEIALIQRDLLLFFGYDIVMTRQTDISIHDEDCVSIRQKKNSDLRNRLKIIESTDCLCFISIHQNMFSVSRYSGTQVFYGGKNEQSKLLAESIQGSVKGMLQNDNERKVKKSTNSIYILYNASKPAVMVECGFMSNESELAHLKSKDYQKKLCFSILCGIANQNETGEK